MGAGLRGAAERQRRLGEVKTKFRHVESEPPGPFPVRVGGHLLLRQCHHPVRVGEVHVTLPRQRPQFCPGENLGAAQRRMRKTVGAARQL
jgi:hypothetical protein